MKTKNNWKWILGGAIIGIILSLTLFSCEPIEEDITYIIMTDTLEYTP